MQFLDAALIQEKYDVVVVGAGIGGITAGALLAQKGLSTLVVEQHYLPGGVCSTVKRQGVAMDAGAALLFGFAPGSQSPHRYVMNTLDEDIEMIHHDALYRMHFQGGKSVTFWRDFERYFEELTEAFPGKDEQFRGFYRECFRLYDAMNANPMPMSPDTVPKRDGLKMMLTHPLRTRRLLKSMDAPMKSVLDKYVRDRDVEGFFDLLIASCYCTSTEETPLMLGTAVICSTHGENGGACYPVGGPQVLANKLESALEKFGGDILYRHLVDEILIKDGRAQGIRLADGTVIHADHVISNADVYQLYGKLIDARHVDPERQTWVDRQIPSVSAVVVYLSVDAEAIPEGTRHIETVISDLKVLESNNYFAYIPTIDDPSIAPEGVHSMSILCSAGDFDWPRPGDPLYQSAEYERQKKLVADRALDVLEERLFPKLRQHIRCMEVGTPSTIERFTLKSRGAIGGPKQMLGQHLFHRLGARTEFERLYAVGDSTSMGEGVVSVTASAVGAANMVLGDRGMEIFSQRSFARERIHYVEGRKRGPEPKKNQPLTPELAKRLAIECQWCEDPSCIRNCPAKVDVPGFVRRIDAGNYAGAARLIRERNPLGELCGRACPAERMCESACTRLDYQAGPVRIAELQAWTCQQAGEAGWAPGGSEPVGRSVAVLGAGPAGLSCAYYLSRLGYEVHLYDPAAQPGGIPASMVPDFRVPSDSVARDVAGILCREEITLHTRGYGVDLPLAQLEREHAAVFLACGLGTGKKVTIKGLEDGSAGDAAAYLAACKDGSATALGGTVVVIGGGSVATDAALMAKRRGASRVVVACLEAIDEMPCLPSERREMMDHGIEVQAGWAPGEVHDGKLKLFGCDAVLDDNGCFAPMINPKRQQSLSFDHIILAVGQTMEAGLAEQLGEELGCAVDAIEVDPQTQRVAGRDGLFAGGDIVRRGGTIVEAVADGRRAAMGIHAHLTRALVDPQG